MMGANSLAGELSTRVDALRRAVEETPNAPAQLPNDVRAIERDLRDIREQLNGDPTLNRRQEPTPPSLMGRMQVMTQGAVARATDVDPAAPVRDSLHRIRDAAHAASHDRRHASQNSGGDRRASGRAVDAGSNSGVEAVANYGKSSKPTPVYLAFSGLMRSLMPLPPCGRTQTPLTNSAMLLSNKGGLRMKRLLTILGVVCAFARPTAVSAQTQQSDIPDIVRAGLDSMKTAGLEAGVRTWLRGSPIDESGAAERVATGLAPVTQKYGAYVDYEILAVVPLGEKERRVYLALHYDRGPLYLWIDCYHAASGWIIPAFLANPQPQQILPPSMIAPRSP